MEGQYCPAGSAMPFSCPEGYYCGSEELANATGECWAGYYCSGGATRPDPQNDATGKILDIIQRGVFVCLSGELFSDPIFSIVSR